MKHVVKKSHSHINHKFLYALMLFCSYALILLYSSSSAQAVVLPDTAKLVPPETVLLVDIDNFNQLKAQFEKTSLYKLYKDPAMAAFIDDAKAKCREKVKELDEKVINLILDGSVLPEGRVAIALILSEQTIDADEPPVLFITQWGQNINKVKEAVEEAVKKAIEGGSHQKKEDYRGVNITTIIDESGSEFSFCSFDDCIIGSMNIDALKFVIAHIKSAASPTLADDADYIASMKATGPYHDIDFYVNIKQIIKTVVAEDDADNVKTIISNLGLDNIPALGFSIGVARTPGQSGCGKAFLKINGAKKGILKILNIESNVIRVPRFVPVSAYAVTFLNLSIKKAYDEFYNILNKFSPMYAAMMHGLDLPPSPEGEPGLKIKTDVIDHLGSQFIIAQSVDKPLPDDGKTVPIKTLVALNISNRSALEKSIALLHSKMIAPNKPDAKRELLGHTIYLVGIPFLPFFNTQIKPTQIPIEQNALQMPKFAFTVTDTHLIFGSESTVEQAIRRLSSTEATSVGSAEWFGAAKSAIPSVVGLAGFEDSATSTELLWRMIKESATNKSVSKDSSTSIGIGMRSDIGLIFSQTGLDFFNFSLLPKFDTVRKYFGLSASYGISRPDGFFFEFKYLNQN